MASTDQKVTKFPRLKLLFSFAYLKMGGADFTALARGVAPYVDLLIDSGAFTNKMEIEKAAALKKTPKLISLDEYMQFCLTLTGTGAEYIQLDVIGDPKRTQENQQKMLDAGLLPIPVFTPGTDWGALREMVTHADGRVCFGGLGAYGDKAVPAVASRAYRETDGRVKAHLLGYGAFPLMMRLPIATCDSSTYTSGGKFGRVMTFNGVDGVTGEPWQLLKKPGKKSMWLAAALRQYQIPADEMTKASNYLKAHGIPALSATYAYIRLSQFVQHKTGKGYYLAVVNRNWFTPIVAVLATMTPAGFDYMQSREIKHYLDDQFLNRGVEAGLLASVDIIQKHTNWERPV